MKYTDLMDQKEIQDMSTHNKLGILIEQYVSASADEKEAKKRKIFHQCT